MPERVHLSQDVSHGLVVQDLGVVGCLELHQLDEVMELCVGEDAVFVRVHVLEQLVEGPQVLDVLLQLHAQDLVQEHLVR